MARKEITDAFNSLFLDARKEYLEALRACVHSEKVI